MSVKVFYEILNQRDTPAMFADVFSNRPAFGYNGRIFISTDTKQIYRDYGTFWDLIADAGAGSGTLQTVCTNGSQTTTDITIVGSGRLFLQALSNGGVLFPAGGSGQVSQDNTNFFWDNTNKRLGINTNTPGVAFDVHSTDNVIQQLNATSTNNSLLSFLNQGTGKWRIGNFYNTANNDFYIYDVLSATPRFYITNTGYTILPTNVIIGSSNRSSAYGMDVYVSANYQSTLRVQGASTFLSAITGNSFVKSGGTSAEILAADGSVITAGTNITISGGTISSSGGGGSMAIGGSITSATAGSVLFAGASGVLAQDNANFFFDNTNDRLGIGTNAPNSSLQINSASGVNALILLGVNGTANGFIGQSYTAAQLCTTSAANDIVVRSQTNLLFTSGGATQRLGISTSGVVTISNLAGTGSRTVLADANGVLSAPVSDKTLKHNIISIGYGLKEIMKMNPVWFDYIDEYKNYGKGRQNGTIAQEMAEIIPEAVFTTPSTGKMGVNYEQMHAIYIKAIQDLKAEIDVLKNI